MEFYSKSFVFQNRPQPALTGERSDFTVQWEYAGRLVLFFIYCRASECRGGFVSR